MYLTWDNKDNLVVADESPEDAEKCLKTFKATFCSSSQLIIFVNDE